MKNLDQIRAKNALQAGKKSYSGVNKGEVVKKIPTMIRENGLLGALAFSIEKSDKGEWKNKGHYGVFESVIEHLADPQITRIPAKYKPEEFMLYLAKDASSAALRGITSEVVAYLNFLRRFAGGEEDNK